VVLTINSTTTSLVVHAVVTDVFTTNYVPVFSPATDLALFGQVAVLLMGVCYGVFADAERHRRALELATVAGVAIICLYVWNYQALGLLILWPLFIGLGIGIVIRVVRTKWNCLRATTGKTHCSR
jgi:MFS family permease